MPVAHLTLAVAVAAAVAPLPAHAVDLTISNNIVGTGLNLDLFAGTTASVSSGVTVSNVVTPIPGGIGSTFPGIFASSRAWTLTNNGTISASFGDGVFFKSGGTIGNSGTISGFSNSIEISGAAGTVNNLATGHLQGAVFFNGVAGTVTNAGSIDGGGVEGVTMQGGGMLTNKVGGTITAHGSNNAVSLILGSSRTVINSGTIQSNESGFGTGVAIQDGAVTNNQGGKILGAFNGIWANGGNPTSITNMGLIEASLADGGGSAIEADGGGTISNSGTICSTTGALDQSDAGILFSGPGTITNAGTIESLDGGLAILFQGSGTQTLVLDTGSVLGGDVRGGSGTDALVLKGIGTEDIGKFLGFSTLSAQGTSWTLTGSGTFTTSVQVQSSLLSVNGQLTSPAIAVLSGGVLGGNGTLVGAVTVASGGAIAPGNSIGTLNVTGPVTFNSGSNFRVEANAAGLSDKLLASGGATLNGGTVQVLPAPGNYGLSNTYTILTANGGVSGTFTGATTSLAFLAPTLTYDAKDVFLTLTRTSSAFASVAQTPNQRAVAAALDASPFGSPLVQAVVAQSASQALRAFDALSGEVHASTRAALLDDSDYLRRAVLGRLRAGENLGGEADITGDALGSPQLAYAANPTSPVISARAPKQLPSPIAGRDVTYWAEDFGAWGRIDGDGNAAGVRRALGGFFTGVDARMGNDARAGLFGGYSRADIQVNARASSATADSAHVGAYAGARMGDLNLRSGMALSWHEIATARSIAFPGFAEEASASYSGSTTQIFGELGHGVSYHHVAIEPFAGFGFAHIATDGFAEQGGRAALMGAGSQWDIGYSTLGTRIATNQLLQNGMMLTPRASLTWQHAFGEVVPTTTMSFLTTGAGFTIAGVPIACNSALVDAGVDLRIAPQATISVAYVGQLAARGEDHALKGGFTWDF